MVLRQDNADLRLTDRGYEVGLVKRQRYDKFYAKEIVRQETGRLRKKTVKPEDVKTIFSSRSTPLRKCRVAV